MSKFRAGKYNREKLGFLKHFAPVQSVKALIDVTPEELIAGGKKLVLVDVDNTLVEWRSEDIPETTLTWLEFMKAAGLNICILSNTRHPERLKRLSKQMDIPYLLGRFKPSRFMYRAALAKFGAQPEQAVMIGDQLFTDILGANRTGIDAIWVEQMTPKDFIGTKVSRFGERLIRRRLHRAIHTPPGEEDFVEELPIGGTAALLQSDTVRQFIKFCIVGASSTAIDWGVSWYLTYYATAGGHRLSDTVGSAMLTDFPGLFNHLVKSPRDTVDAAIPVFKAISSGLAIINSFIWNRRWTFKIKGKEHRSAQFQKFFVISIIGAIIITVVTTVLNSTLPGSTKPRLAASMVIATVIGSLWNFLGQKYWAFKRHEPTV